MNVILLSVMRSLKGSLFSCFGAIFLINMNVQKELAFLCKDQVVKAIEEIIGSDNVRVNEQMKNHTSFKVGGPADILAIPQSADQLQKLYKFCVTSGIDVFVMGNGSNLIVRDKGLRGIVIKITDKIGSCRVNGEEMEAEAGILLSRLSKIALQNNLTGLEFASGIPGTLGGAVTMNAGAYGSTMSDVVIKTEYLDKNGDTQILEGGEHNFGYRRSIIQLNKGIVVKSLIKLKKGIPEEIKSRMDELNKKRKEAQPLEYPSAGSIFKRPEGHFAGKLIQDCGLKGYSIGGAEVSGKHCGFIINKGGATAKDIINLIEYIQQTVFEKFNVQLETEVKIIGEE